jgi:general secretion pathway protein K
MMHRQSVPSASQHGAALLAALLTVALVTTLAAGAMWQQWRGLEVESAERHRAQARWLLLGSLDWARVILREDALADGNQTPSDHLAEPWAVPLQEARLSSFLAALPDGGSSTSSNSEDVALSEQVFLSGHIVDLQSRMTLLNLVQGDRVVPSSLLTFERLFESLGLPPDQLRLLTQGLLNAQRQQGTVLPQRVSQLTWLGLSPQTVAKLSPYINLLPSNTPVNVNTASATVLYASVPSLSLSEAQRLVQERNRSHWSTLEAFGKAIGNRSVSSTTHSVNTRYFEVVGKLRTPSTTVTERSLLQRDGRDLKVLWRESGQWASTPAQPLAASLQ